MQWHASERVEAHDMIEMPGTSLKRSIVASQQHPPHTAVQIVDTLRAL